MDPKKIAKLILPISRDRLGINEEGIDDRIDPSAARLNAAVAKLNDGSVPIDANYDYWAAFEKVIDFAGLDYAKKFIIAELALGKQVEYPAFIHDFELSLMKLFGGDPEIWEAWMKFLGSDGAAHEIGSKAGRYYADQCDWVRLMLESNLPINWTKALNFAIEVHGMDEELELSLNKSRSSDLPDSPDALADDDQWHEPPDGQGFIPELYYKVHGKPE